MLNNFKQFKTFGGGCYEQSQIDVVCLWSAFGAIGDTASPLTLRATRIQDPKIGTKELSSF